MLKSEADQELKKNPPKIIKTIVEVVPEEKMTLLEEVRYKNEVIKEQSERKREQKKEDEEKMR